MEQPIRILHVLGGLDAGGAEAFVMNLYRAVDRQKVQFDFVKHISHKGIYEEEIKKMGGKIFKCPQYKGKNHFEYCKWWKKFFERYPEYCIIHGHVRSTAAIYLKIAKKNNLVTIAHSHSTSNGENLSAVIKDMMQLPIRTIADYLFACSKRAGAWLYGKKAIKKPNFYIVPNGIDLKQFAFNDNKRREIRDKLHIAYDEFVIGHVGRFTEAKNHKFLINLFAEYHAEYPNSRLLLIGDGELFDVVKEQCEKLKVEKSVIMLGSRNDAEKFYQAMDVFVFPSLWEGLGIVAIEAQANGLPCIVSDNVPGEAIMSSECSVLSLNEKEKWKIALKEKNKIGRIQENNRELMKYDIQNVANEMEHFYLQQYKGE